METTKEGDKELEDRSVLSNLKTRKRKKRCFRNIYDNIKESYIGATGDPEEEKRGQKKYLKKYSRS